MLSELIRYTEIADLKIIDVFKSAGKSMPEAEALFSHILNAQHIWIKRIKNKEPLYERFQIHSKEKFLELQQENIATLYDLLSSDMDRIVKYHTSMGDYFEDRVSDILFHLVNHSTYHRAQVATQFRIHNIQPPVTDFIMLRREGLL